MNSDVRPPLPLKDAPRAPDNRWKRALLGAFSVALFAFALISVKEGASPLAPVIRNGFSIDNTLDALGLGWLAAAITLSGSPIAATALAFFQAGVLDAFETFAMIAGSRLGAAFIVLFLGFAYALRSRRSESGLGAGLLSLLVTQTVYFPAIVLGYLLLRSGLLGNWTFAAQASLTSPLDFVFGPMIGWLERIVPIWTLFPVGFVLMLFSFWLFDRALPLVHLQGTGLERINRLLFRPIVSFGLGAGITAVTMSVSVSLGMLVPLSARGFIRQENIIPYIMGANVTTFVDTLVAAALLGNPEAVTIVLLQMISVSAVSIGVILVGFRRYESALAHAMATMLRRRDLMIGYLSASIGVPILLLILA